MINRYLEKTLELSAKELIAGYSEPIKLEYYLLEHEITDFDELTGKTTYGIEIIKKVSGMEDEISTIKNLSCCRENAVKILDKLACNIVTPISMPYIIDDMIGV